MDVKETFDELSGRPKLIITSEKIKDKYSIVKNEDGFVFFKIKISRGKVPSQLDGLYTRLDLALADLKQYLDNLRVSKTVKRDQWNKERDARKSNDAKPDTESDSTVQQGADH